MLPYYLWREIVRYSAFFKCPFYWTDTYRTRPLRRKRFSPLFLSLEQPRCSLVDLPELVNVHALQLLNDAHGDGVFQIVRSFFLRRVFPWLCRYHSRASSFGAAGVTEKGWGALKQGTPKNMKPPIIPGLHPLVRRSSSRCQDDTATAGSWWRDSGEPLYCYRSSSPGI